MKAATKSLLIRILVFSLLSISIISFKGQIFELLRFSRPYILFIFLILILFILFFMKETLYYFFSKNTNIAPARKIEVFLTFILVIVMIFQAITLADQERILDKQKAISETQTEILDKTSSTNWANVEIAFYQKTFIVSAETLANPNVERYPLGLVMINSGKINTGQINLNPLSDRIIHTKLEPNNDINISSQSGKETIIGIHQRECTLGLEEKCDPLIIPKEYNLTLTFKCQFCQSNQRSFNVTLPLCVYHDEKERVDCNENINKIDA